MGLRPVFILGPHKSGTSLLRNLFDGTSAHFVCPVETHFFRLMGRWVDYDLRRNFPEELTRDQLYGRFVQQVRYLNERSNVLGDSDLRGKFDLSAFEKEFARLEQGMSDREVIELYFNALYRSLFQQEMKEEGVIHKTVGMAEHAMELKKIFPEARFIHIVRNPYANLVAFRKFRTYNGPYPLINRLIASLYNNFYFLYKNQQVLDDYHVLRYEDLVSSPGATMKKLCELIGIPFEENMLRPTSLEEDWAGNSSSEEPFRGVDSGRLEAWRKEIHPLEAYYVKQCFPTILRDFDYEALPPIKKTGALRPAKKETLVRYVNNRAYALFTRNF